MSWMVIAIDWQRHDNVIERGLTEVEARDLAEHLDRLSLRCVAREDPPVEAEAWNGGGS